LFRVFKHIFSPVSGLKQTLQAKCRHWKQG